MLWSASSKHSAIFFHHILSPLPSRTSLDSKTQGRRSVHCDECRRCQCAGAAKTDPPSTPLPAAGRIDRIAAAAAADPAAAGRRGVRASVGGGRGGGGGGRGNGRARGEACAPPPLACGRIATGSPPPQRPAAARGVTRARPPYFGPPAPTTPADQAWPRARTDGPEKPLGL
jgi:hypothetical protein